jgi:hypothetical protein
VRRKSRKRKERNRKRNAKMKGEERRKRRRKRGEQKVVRVFLSFLFFHVTFTSATVFKESVPGMMGTFAAMAMALEAVLSPIDAKT